ncbi:hypothetical protein GF373_12285 [bacterium]|nr:hypothetical protein [bacterium]
MQIPSVSTPVTLQWDQVIGADAYVVNISVDGIPAVYMQEVSQQSLTAALPLKEEDLPSRIDWAVLSKKGEDVARTPRTSHFFVTVSDTLPTGTPIPTAQPTKTPTPSGLNAPTLLTPADGALITAAEMINGIEFTWSEVTGAANYVLTIYEKNEPVLQQTVPTTQYTNYLLPSVQTVYQWDVRAGNGGELSSPANRFVFTIGEGYLPTPTPYPLSADLNADQKANAQDVFLFALSYRTNNPAVDFNRDGINTNTDVIYFIGEYLRWGK